MSKLSPYLITDQPGFTPHIGRLISMMNYARDTTLNVVRGLSVAELDFQTTPEGNSLGMLLEHFAAVETYYQIFTFEDRQELTETEDARWGAGLDLGARGRENIQGFELGYYLRTLKEVRTKTLSEFAKHDDAWLHLEFPFWGGLASNRYFCWFHVFEDEINHRGQMRLIHKQLPNSQNRGVLGIQPAAATDDTGLKLEGVNPEGPAGQAGLLAGDVILELNGLDVRTRLYDEIDIRGEAGTITRFVVQRAGTPEPLSFDVLRAAPKG